MVNFSVIEVLAKTSCEDNDVCMSTAVVHVIEISQRHTRKHHVLLLQLAAYV